MGLIINNKTVKGVSIGGNAVKQIEIGGVVVWRSTPDLPDYFYVENCDSVSGSISFENMAGKDIEYSTDGTNWTTLSIPSNTPVTIDNVAPNQKVYLRGDNTYVGSGAGEHITANFSHNLSGNICSLLDKDDFASMASITKSYAFGNLFRWDTKIISASFNLGNVTTLGDDVFHYTFYHSSLRTAPDFSNITSFGSGAFKQTFIGCNNLQTIYVPNVDTWDESKFDNWVSSAGTSAENPIMYAPTQAVADIIPSGDSGYGDYTVQVLAQ